MDKTTIDMAGRINMEPITVSHGLLNHDIRRLPISMRILGYIHHSTPPHLPSGADVDSEFNSPVELADGVVRVKNPIRRPTNGDVSWATLLLNETHMQIQFILKESDFLRLQNSGFKWNLQYNKTIHKVVFHPYVPFIVGDTEGHNRLCRGPISRLHRWLLPSFHPHPRHPISNLLPFRPHPWHRQPHADFLNSSPYSI